MAFDGYVAPDHLVSEKDKQKPEWYRNACNYYIGLARTYKDDKTLKREVSAFNGEINREDYHFILNPYNFSEDRFKNLPGRLRNYDIISPIWRRYMGEYAKSNNAFSVIAVNSDTENLYEDGLIDMVNQRVRQMAANSLNAAGIDSGMASQESPNLADSVKQYKATLKETRAELAQERLDFLKYSTGDETIRLRNYSDWINYGEFYTYRDVRFDDVYKEAVPIEEYYPIDNGKEYVEDNDAGVRIFKMTIPQVLETFGNELSKSQYNYLISLSKEFAEGKTTIAGSMVHDVTNIEGEILYGGTVIDPQENYNFCDNQGYLEVAHVVYKTQVETKILTYIDPLGEEREVEVNLDYKLDKTNGDIKTEIIYRLKVYEQYRLGDEAAGIYLPPEELPVQRTDINNENICKLPYNGRRRIFPGFPSHGIIGTLLPYQIFINILYLARERAIAKNHGKLVVIPQGLITSDGLLSDNEKIYFAQADGKLYVDETNPNFSIAVQGLKSVDTGDTEFILGLGQLIEETKLAAQEDVDMNRQRYGDTLASDGKYTTQQALIRSSLGSAIINDIFNKTYERDYEADMDYSKVAWINGKKGNYINSDRQVAFFEVNGLEHAETSYGIFAVNNAVEQEKLDQLRDLAFSAGQNGDLLVASDAINATSTSKLRKLIREYAEISAKRAENAQKAEQENAQKVEQIKRETEERKLQSAEKIAQYEGNIKLQLKELDVLIAKLKIASEEDRANLEAQIEDKKMNLQNYINQNQEDVESNQRMLGLI